MRKAIHLMAARALTLGCAGCSKVREDELIGTYCLQYGRGLETLKIFPDGTHKLTYTRDGKYQFTNSGTWEIEHGDIYRELAISFTNFVIEYENENDIDLYYTKELLSKQKKSVIFCYTPR